MTRRRCKAAISLLLALVMVLDISAVVFADEDSAIQLEQEYDSEDPDVIEDLDPVEDIDEVENLEQAEEPVTDSLEDDQASGEEESEYIPDMTENTSDPLAGDKLDCATVRFRPAGSWSALSVKDDGKSGQNVIHLFNTGHTSRFYLENTHNRDDSYVIRMFEYFDKFTPRKGLNSVLDLEKPYKKAGSVIHIVGDDGSSSQDNKHWWFLRQDDGTYYIKNVYSGMYWSLEHPSRINDNKNKLCQSKTPMKWEMEIIATFEEDVHSSIWKKYDSYTFMNDGKRITAQNWMSELPDDTYLSDLSIPGVHDAGTCRIIGRDVAHTARCQQFYIDDLFDIGIRFLDLRIYERNPRIEFNTDLAIEHGIFHCGDRANEILPLWHVMYWCREFLENNPRETIILSIKNESPDTSLIKDKVYKEIYKFFNDYVQDPYWRSRIYVGDGMPKLKDVRGKIVLISRVSKEDLKSDKAPYNQDFWTDGGRWAIPVSSWKTGKNYNMEKSAEGDKYELWTQDYYDANSTEKWKWISSALLDRGDGAVGPEARRAEVESRGKKAWIVNYTSCDDLPSKDPISNARDINKWMKTSSELSTNADTYMGIVCGDFVDEQWAQRIYRINYREPVNKKRQSVSFEGITWENFVVEKTYGDGKFTITASSKDAISKQPVNTTIHYFSHHPEVAEVDRETGEVTIKRAGWAVIGATAGEIGEYQTGRGGYMLKVNPRPVTVEIDDVESVYGKLPKAPKNYHLYEGQTLVGEDAVESLGVVCHPMFPLHPGVDSPPAGHYDIVGLLDPDEANSNYSVKIKPGTYTIKKVPAPNNFKWPEPRSGLVESAIGLPMELLSNVQQSEIPEGYTLQFRVNRGEWTNWLVPKGKDAGAYTIEVRYKGDKNHVDSDEHIISVIISKSENRISPGQDYKVNAVGNLRFDNAAHNLISASGGLPEGYTGVKYRLIGGTDWSDTIPTGTDAGAYGVEVLYVDDNNNNNIEKQGDDIAVTIQKKNAPDQLDDPQKPVAIDDLRYDDNEHQLVTAPTSPLDGYTIEYSTDNGETWSDEIPTATGGGSHFVMTRYIGDNNHKSFYGETVRVTIAKLDPPDPDTIGDTQKPAAVKDLVYNGSAQELLTAPASLPANYVRVEYSIDGGLNWSEEIPAVTDAGEYNVKVRYISNGNYEDFVGDDIMAGIERIPAPDQLTGSQKPTVNSGLSYNGNAQPLVTAPTQLPDGYTAVMYSVGGKGGYSYKIPEGTDIGNYSIKVRYAGDDNHEDFDGEDLEASIIKNITPSEPVSISNAKVVLNKTSFTYNAKVQKPTIKTIDGLSLKKGTDYKVKWSNSSSKKAGTYTVTITGIGGYTGVAKATYKIKKLSIKNAKVVLETADVPYNGGKECVPKFKTIGGKKLKKGTDFTVKYSKSPKKLGKYTMTITGKGSCSGKTTAKFTVVKAPNKATKVTSSKTVKYSKLKKKSQSFKISAKVKEKAKITFKLSSVPKKAKKYITVSEEGKVKVKKGLKKGTYEIKVKITAAKTEHYKKTTVTKAIKITVK